MNVTYYINTGASCNVAHGISGATLKEAIADFKAYITDCQRFGNDYSDAHMEVICDRLSSRMYEVGKLGGIVRNKEWE
jgi:hypothetical protein